MNGIITESKRLTLRQYTENDTDLMLKTFNEPDFIRFVEDKNIRTKDDALKRLQEVEFNCYQQDGFGSWLVEIKETGEKIGSCGVFRRTPESGLEIGYAFVSDYYGNGYCTEAAQAVIDWVKNNLGDKEITATTSPEHQASIKVLTKLGFEFVRQGPIEAYDGVSNVYKLTLLS